MRLYRIDQMIHEEGAVSFESMRKALQCSAPTLKRDLRYLRTRLNSPIVYSRKLNRYIYSEENQAEGGLKALPCTWYSATEMYALLVALDLFDRVKNEKEGMLKGEMSSMRARLLSLLQEDKNQARELMKRLRVFLPRYAENSNAWFEIIGSALTQRKRLSIVYFALSKKTESVREVSPMRLVNYKGRWYLDAWCHTTDALKTFSLSRIKRCEMLTTQCEAVAMRDVNAALDAGYGLFSGGEIKKAVIAIDAYMAAYVKDEIWHAEQKITVNADGSIALEVPYAKEDELIGRLLELGEHARVTAPVSLIQSVKGTLEKMRALYVDRTQS